MEFKLIFIRRCRQILSNTVLFISFLKFHLFFLFFLNIVFDISCVGSDRFWTHTGSIRLIDILNRAVLCLCLLFVNDACLCSAVHLSSSKNQNFSSRVNLVTHEGQTILRNFTHKHTHTHFHLCEIRQQSFVFDKFYLSEVENIKENSRSDQSFKCKMYICVHHKFELKLFMSVGMCEAGLSSFLLKKNKEKEFSIFVLSSWI